MNSGPDSARRHRFVFLVVAAACALTTWVGIQRSRSGGSPAVEPAAALAVASPARCPALEPVLTADAASQRTQVVADARVDGEPRAPEDERSAPHAAWGLVARLEQLARAPRSFHAAALPVIERLTAVCATGASQSDSAAGLGEVVADLQRIVVANPQRDPLVRGAVYLGLAPLIPEVEFQDTFTEWLSGHSSVPLELVRTAALAAARRGSPSPCRHPLALAKLSALPTLGAPELPGFYPLALDRIASGRACDALRRWLDRDDPRREWFRLASSAPPAGEDLGSAGDYFVTVEVLLCVWGHRSLEDTAVERALLREARSALDAPSEHSLVSLRAANFLVLALAGCNAAFFDFALATSSDQDSPLSDLLGEIQGVLGEELGLATLALLERLRHSERPSDRADFTLALAALRDDFLRGEARDPQQRELLLEYLCGLVADPGLSSTVRMNAVHAVGAGGSWAAIRDSAVASFRPGAPLDLSALALEPLLAAARANPEHAAEALALLRTFAAQAPASAATLGVESYIDELTQ